MPDKNIHETMTNWEFNSEVTKVFDEMLERSIPQYAVMRELVHDLGVEFISVLGANKVVDIGCSRGEALASFAPQFKLGDSFLGLEISEPMLEAAAVRFKDHKGVKIRKWDLRHGLPIEADDANLILSVLTLMFTPINYRLMILDGVYRALKPGGAFILVEKLLGGSAKIDYLMVNRYHRMKAENGYSQEEIERKKLALEGVQVPLTAQWNEEALKMAGFKQVDCFWRWMSFAGWIAIK